MARSRRRIATQKGLEDACQLIKQVALQSGNLFLGAVIGAFSAHEIFLCRQQLTHAKENSNSV